MGELIRQFEKKDIVLSCWICKRKRDEEIIALFSIRDSNNEKQTGFNGNVLKYKTILTPYSIQSKSYNKLEIFVCQSCRFLIQEINKPSKKLKEEKIDDNLFYR